jgi:hypothetical protein
MYIFKQPNIGGEVVSGGTIFVVRLVLPSKGSGCSATYLSFGK